MNAQLGSKRFCPQCSTKFYDMNAQEIKCPKCDHKFPKPQAVKALSATGHAVSSRPKTKRRRHEEDELENFGEVIELVEMDEDELEDIIHLKEVEDHTEEPDLDKNSDDGDDGMFIDEIGDDDLHLVDDLDEDEEKAV